LKRTDHRRLMHLHAALIAAARNSIGLMLVGGMFIGSLFTLFIIPSI
jgi:multidrug efflux pump subunit AcrB